MPKDGRDDFDEGVRELIALADELYPEPVDVFENLLAKKLGLVCGPGTSEGEWRAIRMKLIDSFPDDERMASFVAAVERQINDEKEARESQWDKERETEV